MIEIDGSQKSGSGTIVRYALTLASLLHKGLRIYNIRAKRKKPGLQPQHLKTVEAFKELTGAEVKGCRLNSSEVIFKPKRDFIKAGDFSWDIGTAGSSTMMGLALLPLGFFAEKSSTYRISGGLFQDFAPNAFHTKHVLLELLKKFSLDADLKVIRPGYVPRGGGIIEINVKPKVKKITPLKLTVQGKPVKVAGVAISSHLNERKVSQRMADECNKALGKRGIRAEIEIVSDTAALQRGAALSIWLETDSGCILGADRAGKIGRTSEEIGKYVAAQLLEDLDSGATVDRYSADQLIIYAALAEGESEYIISQPTEHIQSNLWLIQDILGAQAWLGGNRLKIKGIGFQK